MEAAMFRPCIAVLLLALVALPPAAAAVSHDAVDASLDRDHDRVYRELTARAIERLAQRNDARALLARGMLEVTVREAMDFDAIHAAAAAPDADAHVLHRALTLAPSTPWPAQARERALERLRELAADNLAVHDIDLPAALAAGPEAIDDWLAEAATADHHALGFGASIALMVGPFAGLPIDDALVEAARNLFAEPDADIDAEIAAMAPVLGIAMAFAIPALQHHTAICHPDHGRAWSPHRHAPCLAIARTLATRSDTLIVASIGARLWQALAADADEAAAADARMQELRWLQRMGLLPLLGSDYLRLQLEVYREGGDEIDALRAAAERAGVPATPPEGWDMERP
jgi:hypothetical protein